MAPGEDGAYVVTRPTDAGIELGTDYSGLQKLYYFTDHRAWCISNSVSRLAEHLREHDVRLKVNFAQLQALNAGKTLTAQLSSFETPLHGVRLVPSMCTLVVSEGGLSLRPLPSPEPVSYDQALTEFLTIWRARITTLLRDPRASVTADLTGGVDSRAVFALLQSSANSSSSQAKFDLLSHTSERWSADLRSARTVARRYGTDLNLGLAPSPRRAGGVSRYQVWRELSLGTYLPIYFHRHEASPFRIHFHGGGGENHRPFYPRTSIDEFFAELKDMPPHFYRSWRADTREAIDFLVRNSIGVDPLILHYREFRNRLHSGRAPQYATVIAPLSSKYLDRASAHRRAVAGHQINFDIMENLLPGLAALPYDTDKKRPGAEQYANMTRVRLADAVQYGNMFAAGTALEVPAGGSPVSALDLLAADLAQGSTAAVRDFVGDPLLERARGVLNAARRKGTFEHASHAKELSYALAVSMAFRSGALDD